MCNCVLPVTLNSTKVRHHHRIEDKQCEDEKQSKQSLTHEQPNKVTISNSTPSRTSSPASASSGLRRGRSRTRRPLPPPSPLINCSPSSWCLKFEIFYCSLFILSNFILQKLLSNKQIRKATDLIFNWKLLLFILYHIQWGSDFIKYQKTCQESWTHGALLVLSRDDPPWIIMYRRNEKVHKNCISKEKEI
jgi:hypothetical protein